MAQTVTKPGPASPGVFTLDETDLKYVQSVPQRGRSTTPPPHLDAVREAVKTSDVKGLALGDVSAEGALDKALRKARADLTRSARAVASELALGADKFVRISAKVVKDHPKYGTFLAWSAAVADMPAKPETTDIARDAGDPVGE